MAAFIDPKLIEAAKQKLKSGKTKQDTFEELLQEFDQDPEKLAKMIRFIPTQKKRKKYFPWSIVTSCLLLGLLCIETFQMISKNHETSGQFIFLGIFTLFMVFGILRSNPVFHSGAAFFGGARLLFIGLHIFKGTVTIDALLFLKLIMSLAVLVLGFYLRTKLDSRYTTNTDENIIDGNHGIRFPD